MPELLTDPIDVLNRVLRILLRSLPAYLESTQAWSHRDPRQIRPRLAAIARNQQLLAGCVVEAIRKRHGRVDSGQFPLAFTSLHDVGPELLIEKTIAEFEDDLPLLEQCVTFLQSHPVLLPLAEEALGNVRGHLDSLNQWRQELS